MSAWSTIRIWLHLHYSQHSQQAPKRTDCLFAVCKTCSRQQKNRKKRKKTVVPQNRAMSSANYDHIPFCWLQDILTIHRVSKNVPPLACYNFDTHEWILMFFFGRNVTDKVGNQKTLYYATSNNLCFCTTWQNVETGKSYISLNWIVLHTPCTCALSSLKKKLSSVMCLVASKICWDSKISY